jgi:hypothetical protein
VRDNRDSPGSFDNPAGIFYGIVIGAVAAVFYIKGFPVIQAVKQSGVQKIVDAFPSSAPNGLLIGGIIGR